MSKSLWKRCKVRYEQEINVKFRNNLQNVPAVPSSSLITPTAIKLFLFLCFSIAINMPTKSDGDATSHYFTEFHYTERMFTHFQAFENAEILRGRNVIPLLSDYLYTLHMMENNSTTDNRVVVCRGMHPKLASNWSSWTNLTLTLNSTKVRESLTQPSISTVPLISSAKTPSATVPSLLKAAVLAIYTVAS